MDLGSFFLCHQTIEWAYYLTAPPFGTEDESKDAIRFSSAYRIFYWGPVAWAIYTLPALPISYYY
ncbi:BCCT family transporter [Oikeobacillus pervagus]|uniref:BCCT family transporter n=1 Tax=Oikeobacillus pervagus TaxID=1325931 RepID=UPI0027D7F5F1|nr:BCCT family transporter [Oikeobacillus pervagus]